MTGEGSSAATTSTYRSWINPKVLGTSYCIASAVAYAVMGICMRAVSTSCDPVWVNCVQAVVGTVAALAYLMLKSERGRSLWPEAAVAAGLMLLGTITQLGGATYQWAIGTIGLAISNPLQMGVTLVVSALLGLLVMHERISKRGILAIFLLSTAVLCLSFGADTASANMDENESSALQAAHHDSSESIVVAAREHQALMGLLGIAAAAVSGVAFAILMVGIRKVATGDTTAAAIVFYINLMGIVVLGPWSLQRLGVEGIFATSRNDMAVMLGVGASNLIAFLLLTKGLQLTTVVRANILVNSLTLVLSVIAGIVIFSEPSSYGLVVGMLLSLAGIGTIGFAEANNGNESAEKASVVSVGARVASDSSVGESAKLGLV